MKVLLINGSPHEHGCTYTALTEVANQLARRGVESELLHIGRGPVRGCVACNGCSGKGHCVFTDDRVNECIDRIHAADGLVVGSPVYFSGPAGSLCSFLDRVFYAKDSCAHKPAAAVVSCRRGGASAAFERLNQYFAISSMPVVSSQYWNSVHGNAPEEVRQDLEGLQTMRTLADNMAWLLESLRQGAVSAPPPEARVATNFIR